MVGTSPRSFWPIGNHEDFRSPNLFVRAGQYVEAEFRRSVEEETLPQLEKVTKMFQRGIITTAEFQVKMAEILAEIPV